MGASVRKICEKCRLIRRKGRIRVISSNTGEKRRVVVWASAGACGEVCEKCRLIRRKGRIRVISSNTGERRRVVVLPMGPFSVP